MAGIGDNSMSKDLLQTVCEECEKLIEERKAVSDQIKAVLDKAEADGLDKKTIREMIRLRALDKEERDERERIRDLYLCSLGLA